MLICAVQMCGTHALLPLGNCATGLMRTQHAAACTQIAASDTDLWTCLQPLSLPDQLQCILIEVVLNIIVLLTHHVDVTLQRSAKCTEAMHALPSTGAVVCCNQTTR